MHTVSKISMIILMQPDLASGVEFYQSIGCRLLFHLREKWAEFSLNGVKIGLCPTTTHTSDTDGRRTGIVLEVADVRSFYEHHKKSITFMDEPTEALHGIMVSIKDPGGNIIDLYQPTPERVKDFAQRVAGQACCKGENSTTCCRTADAEI